MTKCIIKVQQDNAKLHIRNDDMAWQQAIKHSGLDIQLVEEKPNSQDLHILDLSLFTTIQAKQYLKKAININKLIVAVK